METVTLTSSMLPVQAVSTMPSAPVTLDSHMHPLVALPSTMTPVLELTSMFLIED